MRGDEGQDLELVLEVGPVRERLAPPGGVELPGVLVRAHPAFDAPPSVQVLVDGPADGLGQPSESEQVLERGRLDRPHAAHLGDELAPPRRAEAGDTVEGPPGHAPATQLAVEADGEAVRLVPGLLQQVDRLAVARNLDGLGPSGHEHLLQLLGEGGDRHLVGQAELLEDAHADAELALSPVEEQQLRRVGKARLCCGGARLGSSTSAVLGRHRGSGNSSASAVDRLLGRFRPHGARPAGGFEQAPQAPGEHLVHGAVVVVALHGGHLEAPVVAPLGQAVLEHDHRAHVVGPWMWLMS